MDIVSHDNGIDIMGDIQKVNVSPLAKDLDLNASVDLFYKNFTMLDELQEKSCGEDGMESHSSYNQEEIMEMLNANTDFHTSKSLSQSESFVAEMEARNSDPSLKLSIEENENNLDRSRSTSPHVKVMELNSDKLLCELNSAHKLDDEIIDNHTEREFSSTKENKGENGNFLTSSTIEKKSVSPDMSPSGKKSDYFKESRRKDDSSMKHANASPRRVDHSPSRHRRRERSMSRSPVKRRDYRDRSRSRSPYARDRYRRSPRRYSPRRRSPVGYDSRRRSPRRRQWSPPANRCTGLGKPGKILFVAGFSFLTTERDLDRKFSKYGRVRDIRIVRERRSGDSRGFGFITMQKDEEADESIRALDKTEWNGRIILVEKSKSSGD